MEASPRAFAISPCGHFLLAAGEISHRVATYTIDGSTGCLTKLAERTVGANPNWIEMMPLAIV
jgi:6-phosphogluconolactonase